MVLMSSDNNRQLLLFLYLQTLGQASTYACLALAALGQLTKPKGLFAVWVAQKNV